MWNETSAEALAARMDALAWAKQDGLLPAIVQDAATHSVLMLGYMNREALQQTLATRRVTFWSRSKARLWTKGEQSGHWLDLVSIEADCDHDTLLLQVRPNGPTCHLGRASCFEHAAPAVNDRGKDTTGDMDFLDTLDTLVQQRERERPAGSYTTRLFEGGIRRIAQKVGEEGVETSLAGVAQDDEALLGEAADLVFHLIVLLRARGLSLRDAVRVLERRHAAR